MKKKKIILSILIILLIILLIFILMLNNYQSKRSDGQYSQKDIQIVSESIDNYLKDKITPRGISRLYGSYNGENDLNDLYRSIYTFVNYLPTLNDSKLDDSTAIKTYYEANKQEIKNNTGISSLESFEKMISYMKETGYKGQTFVDCELRKTSFSSSSKYFSFELIFNFEGLSDEIKLKVYFANNKVTNPKTYYSVIEK